MKRTLGVVRSWWMVAALVAGGTLCTLLGAGISHPGTTREVVFGAGVVMVFAGLWRFYHDDGLWGGS